MLRDKIWNVVPSSCFSFAVIKLEIVLHYDSFLVRLFILSDIVCIQESEGKVGNFGNRGIVKIFGAQQKPVIPQFNISSVSRLCPSLISDCEIMLYDWLWGDEDDDMGDLLW